MKRFFLLLFGALIMVSCSKNPEKEIIDSFLTAYANGDTAKCNKMCDHNIFESHSRNLPSYNYGNYEINSIKRGYFRIDPKGIMTKNSLSIVETKFKNGDICEWRIDLQTNEIYSIKGLYKPVIAKIMKENVFVSNKKFDSLTGGRDDDAIIRHYEEAVKKAKIAHDFIEDIKKGNTERASKAAPFITAPLMESIKNGTVNPDFFSDKLLTTYEEGAYHVYKGSFSLTMKDNGKIYFSKNLLPREVEEKIFNKKENAIAYNLGK